MKNLKHNLLYGVIGASSGLSTVAASINCSGGACSSCFACVGVGGGVVLMLLVSRVGGRIWGEKRKS